jgi:hypothetical protein
MSNGNGDSKPVGLHAKIMAAQSAITHIVPGQQIKGGPSSGHRYASKAEVFAQVKGAIHAAGLAVEQSMKDCSAEKIDLPDDKGQPIPYIFTKVTMEFTVADIDPGENAGGWFKSLVTTISIDKASMADTATQAAATSAIRQFYCDFFQAPVMEESADKIPAATAEQKAKIKTLYKQVTIDRDTWGKMVGLSAGESRAPEEEFQRIFGQLWANMDAEKAKAMISQLDIIKVLQEKPTVKGTGKPSASAGGRPGDQSPDPDFPFDSQGPK